MSSRTHFSVIDQAIKSLKTVEEYINVGMETTIDVALDFVENDKDNRKEIDSLRNVMRDYVKMERDLKHFLIAVDNVKKQASTSRENVGLEVMLDKRLEELCRSSTDHNLDSHEKYVDLNEKILEIQNQDDPAPSSSIQTTVVDEDVAMTQTELNTRCPYTGKEMVNPVQNKVCRHNYEKEAILHYIKTKRNKARCPVGGCKNEKPMQACDLMDNKELKRHIELKARQAGKKVKRTNQEVL